MAFEGSVWTNCRTIGVLRNSAGHVGYVGTMRDRRNIRAHCRAGGVFGNCAEQMGYLGTIVEGCCIVNLLDR